MMHRTTSTLAEFEYTTDTVPLPSPPARYVETPISVTRRMSHPQPADSPLLIHTLSPFAQYQRRAARDRRDEFIEGYLLGLFCWVSVILAVVAGAVAV